MSTQPPRPAESGDSGVGDCSASRDVPLPATAPHQDASHDSEGNPASTTAWRAEVSTDEADRASRTYWDGEADAYQAEHGAFLGGSGGVVDSDIQAAGIDYADGGGGTRAGFVWGPEGVPESELQMLGPLGDLGGRRVLELGCGAAQCSAWLAQRGVHAVGVDISVNQLRHAFGAVGVPGKGASAAARVARADVPPEPGDRMRQEQPTGTRLLGQPAGRAPSEPESAGQARGEAGRAASQGLDGDHPGTLRVVAATATALPFADATFAAAFSAYGAVQFVADLPRLLGEVHRVLVPGGRWVFSVTHPIRWAFPDDPGPLGLSVSGSYFDRTPYVERDGSGAVTYAEFHRTLGQYVDSLVRAGFDLERVVEPEWPEWNEQTWGGWSPLRGLHLPGTLLIGCRASHCPPPA